MIAGKPFVSSHSSFLFEKARLFLNFSFPFTKDTQFVDAPLGLITYTAGTGFNASVRTLVTGMVPPASIARLYTAIAITETVGGLIAGPSYSLVFQIGLGIGGGWLGLPFMTSAALFGIVVGIMFAVRIRAEEIMGEEQHQSGGERAMIET